MTEELEEEVWFQHVFVTLCCVTIFITLAFMLKQLFLLSFFIVVTPDVLFTIVGVTVIVYVTKNGMRIIRKKYL